tara:strand:+ start:120 stop:1118 length:999 start_codon:yes stop_codon:yes gene_type:complete
MNGKILLVGGGGYIGTIVTKHFISKGFSIECLDNFIYRNSFSIDEFKGNKKFNLTVGDIRDENLLDSLLNSCDAVIILAGLVGDPITKKYPELSEKINFDAIKKLIDKSKNKKIDKLIFVSTCSNYGLSESDELLNEEAPLKPLSLYAKQKVEIEKYILTLKEVKDFSPTILRFSTAFGLSPRMRFDLTINQFTKSIFFKENLEVFDSNTWRPYCHVQDFALALERVLSVNKKDTDFEVFNVGGDRNNYTKKQITEQILKLLPGNNKVSFTNKKFDPRNYRVNFSKIEKKLNFKVKYSVEDGIREIINYFNKNKNKIKEFDSDLFGNYSINL